MGYPFRYYCMSAYLHRPTVPHLLGTLNLRTVFTSFVATAIRSSSTLFLLARAL